MGEVLQPPPHNRSRLVAGLQLQPDRPAWALGVTGPSQLLSQSHPTRDPLPSPQHSLRPASTALAPPLLAHEGSFFLTQAATLGSHCSSSKSETFQTGVSLLGEPTPPPLPSPQDTPQNLYPPPPQA